jgi:hypothetical protein
VLLIESEAQSKVLSKSEVKMDAIMNMKLGDAFVFFLAFVGVCVLLIFLIRSAKERMTMKRMARIGTLLEKTNFFFGYGMHVCPVLPSSNRRVLISSSLAQQPLTDIGQLCVWFEEGRGSRYGTLQEMIEEGITNLAEIESVVNTVY